MLQLGYSTYCSSNDPVFPGYELGHSDRKVTPFKGFHHRLHTQDPNQINRTQTLFPSDNQKLG